MRRTLPFLIWFSIVLCVAVLAAFLVWRGWMLAAIELERLAAVLPAKHQAVAGTEGPALSSVEGWKTYRNEEYGFEVRYPGNWQYEPKTSTPSSPGAEPVNDPPGHGVIKDFSQSESLWLSVRVYDLNEKNLTIASPAILNLFSLRRAGNNYKILGYLEERPAKLVTIQGKESIRGRTASQSWDGDVQPYEQVVIHISPGIFVALLGRGLSEKMFDQILSTFRFIKPIDTSNWKNYRNEEYGFEVRYPPRYDLAEYPTGNTPYSAKTIVLSSDKEISIEVMTPDSINKGKRECEKVPFDSEPCFAFSFYECEGGMLDCSWYYRPPSGAFWEKRAVRETDGIHLVADIILSVEKTETTQRLDDTILQNLALHGDIPQSDIIGVADFNQILSTFKFIEPKLIGTPGNGTPQIVKTLCSARGEYEFQTPQGEKILFRGGSQSAYRCAEGEESFVWKIDEGPIPEGGTFYFDYQGNYSGFCQLLFRRQDCERFEYLSGSCEAEDYCAGLR